MTFFRALQMGVLRLSGCSLIAAWFWVACVLITVMPSSQRPCQIYNLLFFYGCRKI